ncbi:prepilin-type N-terminal cleavage/methylation domain-containing protein, partial [Phytobacter sp. V91]
MKKTVITKKNRKGFSLLELLLVLGIVAALVVGA